MSMPKVSPPNSHRTMKKASPTPEPSDLKSESLRGELHKLVADKKRRRKDLLRAYHTGQIVRDLYAIERESQYGKRWMHDLASRVHPGWEEEDRNLHGFLYRAREFAKWRKEEVRRLAHTKGKSGKSLSWEHVIRLLAVDDEKKRRRLVQSWCRHEFTVRRWQREIQKADQLRPGGRPPAKPETLSDALLQVVEMASRWIMWHENNLGKAPEGKEPFLDQFPPKLNGMMTAALPDIENIRDVAERHWKQTLDTTDLQTSRTSKARKRRMARSPKT